MLQNSYEDSVPVRKPMKRGTVAGGKGEGEMSLFHGLIKVAMSHSTYKKGSFVNSDLQF